MISIDYGTGGMGVRNGSGKMAGILTVSRIFLSFLLLCTRPLSCPFYILYVLAGFTDMIDGIIARKTNTASEMGAKLDTAEVLSVQSLHLQHSGKDISR